MGRCNISKSISRRYLDRRGMVIRQINLLDSGEPADGVTLESIDSACDLLCAEVPCQSFDDFWDYLQTYKCGVLPKSEKFHYLLSALAFNWNGAEVFYNKCLTPKRKASNYQISYNH